MSCGSDHTRASERIIRIAVAFSDDEKLPSVVYTFTTKGHPAHPAAVCRKQSKEGANLVLQVYVKRVFAPDAMVEGGAYLRHSIDHAAPRGNT